MTKLTAFTLLALGISTPALADRPGKDWITAERVTIIAREAGYTQISKVEADDSRWEVEALKDGQRFEFDVHPTTGAITNARRDD